MSGLRRSARAKTSTIQVNLNEKNEIEYFDVVKVVEEIDENDETESLDLDQDDDYAEVMEYEEEDQDEEEEELIANADGTMSIKIPEPKPKKKKVPIHHICAKCSKVHLSHAVNFCNFWNRQ